MDVMISIRTVGYTCCSGERIIAFCLVQSGGGETKYERLYSFEVLAPAYSVSSGISKLGCQRKAGRCHESLGLLGLGMPCLASVP